MFKYFKRIWQTKDLRKKIMYTLGAVVLYRLVAHITVPGVNHEALRAVFDSNNLLGVFAAFTGGSMENFSITLMGISPYINASIIMQLMAVVIPKLEQLNKEGEAGRRTITRWTRYLTLPLAILQSYGMTLLLNNSAGAAGTQLISSITDPTVILPIMISITAGTIFLMWLGELITEKGIGNGISILIFAGIVAAVPGVLGQTLGLASFDETRYLPFMIMAIVTLILTVFVVLVTEGYRNIPVTYAGQQAAKRQQQAGIPIRVNQAGMIPIIFAVSLITFPTLIAQFFVGNPIADWIIANLGGSDAGGGWFYSLMLFIFVLGFSFFYVSITFQPKQIAENLQKRGGFVPGIRPGKQTVEHLQKVSDYMNLWGGLFIAFLAVAPIIMQNLFAELNLGSVQLLMSGAGIIIVVGVVVDLVRRVNTQLTMHNYDKFY